MFRFRRRSVAVRFGIVAAVIGLVALALLPGAGATLASAVAPARAAAPVKAVTATATSSAVPTVGQTKCVPSGTDDLGLTCTGTYGGDRAWDPWTGQMLPASDPPTVTISQASDLTDQDVKVTWQNFTPILDGQFDTANPSSPLGAVFPVSIFECKGTNPDFSDAVTLEADCYTVPVGSVITAWQGGPPNAQMGFTMDGDAPPTNAIDSALNSILSSPYSAAYGYNYIKNVLKRTAPLPSGSPFCTDTPPSQQCTYNGGDPSSWSGQADFHVETHTPTNKDTFFSCNVSTPCSLVVDPIWGGESPTGNRPYEWPEPSSCHTHDIGLFDAPVGDLEPAGGESVSDGTTTEPSQQPPLLIGNSGSCWAADRIVIPLSFAATSKDCPSTAPQFYAEGSPMTQLQMNQWLIGWCTGAGALTVNYTSNPESVARNDFLNPPQFGNRADMALVSLPADATAQQASSRKFTYAPLANSGIGVAFELDDMGTAAQINRLVLNPELLAKLTTQSYELQYGGCTPGAQGAPPQPSLSCDPAVLNDPETLFDDNEFLSLNQDCEPVGAPYAEGEPYTCGTHNVPVTGTPNPLGVNSSYSDFPTHFSNAQPLLGTFLPTVLSGDSDMTYDMTNVIADDPTAKAFLNTNVAPGGVHVNDNYLHVPYPVSQFNVLDDGFTNLNVQECQFLNGKPDGCAGGFPNTTMFVSWVPQQDLATIVQDLLTNQTTAESTSPACPGTIGAGNGCTNATELTYPPVGTLSQGQRDLLSVLDLGDIAVNGFATASIVNADGVPVAPSQASVEAAVEDMKTNPDGVTQFFDYSSTTDKAAYPLSMVNYAMVPTCGLSKSEASAIAEFLTRAATTGQVQGGAPGQLGPGYYPLTAAQKAQTLEAASEVRSQDCKSLPPDHRIDGHPAPNDVTPAGSSTHKTTGPGGPAGSHASPAGKNGPGQGGPTGANALPAKAQTAAFGQKSPDSGLTGLLLLLAMIVGGLAIIGGPAAWVVTVTGKWPVVARYTRPAWAWARPAWTRVRATVIRRP
jgi:hypothetical protein